MTTAGNIANVVFIIGGELIAFIFISMIVVDMGLSNYKSWRGKKVIVTYSRPELLAHSLGLIVMGIGIVMLIMLLIPTLATAAELELGYRASEHIDTERAGHVGLAYGHKSFSVSTDYNYGKINETTNVHDGAVVLNYSHKLSSKWSLWVNEAAGFDKPAGIESENRLGAGPKYVFIKSDNAKASVAVGYLSHYQRLEDDTRITERWSLRLKAHYKGVQAVVFHQPAVYSPEQDFINKGVLTVDTVLTGPLSLRYVLQGEYRSMGANKVLQALNVVYRFGGE